MASREKDKDKGVNVQVLLRCRPFNEDELRSNAPQVISCYDHRREVTVCQNIASKQIDRTFTFDKVFGPQSQQKDLYEQAVVPIVHEVLDGFNCTIFAYGQTGTGKTYTMEGSGRKTKNGGLPPDAGVIPRSVQQIFDTLESQNAEYSVKVTFLELYNEEITDLLAPEDFMKGPEDKQRKPLALMEDGKGGVLVRGLEEEIVTSASEIYNLLDRGSAKRRTAETLLNKQSSRSHSIFSITIHIKEATPEGEELIKCGKLNLVDLAGSENISRSGAREGRAREAGEINKSLLTLGRVITALVEHLAHIPYRDSKLTRLLRDSLGGKTKTCIIATVSPSVYCLDETLSTLDYAHRAKNIRNKPEVNQKMMKSALIKDLYGEIERLKVEVYAAREKNGIYLPRERFLQDEIEKKTMVEKIEVMGSEIELKDKQIEELQDLCEFRRQQHADLSLQHEATQIVLNQTQSDLSEAMESNKQAQQTIREHEFVISAQQKAEGDLSAKAVELRSNLDCAVSDVGALFSKLERKVELEAGNGELVQKFQKILRRHMEGLHNVTVGSVTSQRDLLRNMNGHLRSFLAAKDQSVDQLQSKLDGLKTMYLSQAQAVREIVNAHEMLSSSVHHRVNSTVSKHAISLDQMLGKHLEDAESILLDLRTSLTEQQRETAEFAQMQSKAASENLYTIRNTVRDMLDSLGNLHNSAIEFAECLESRSKAHDASLSQLAETYKEQEEREKSELLDGIAGLLADSMSRQLELVQSRVSELRTTSTSDASKARSGLSSFEETASSARDRLDRFMKSAEVDAEATKALLAAKLCQLEAIHQTCAKSVEQSGDHWKATQSSLHESERNHITDVVSVVTHGLEANQSLNAECQTLNSVIVSHVETETSETVCLIEGARKAEHTAAAELQSMMEAQITVASELERCHCDDVAEIQQIAEQYLHRDYKKDESTGYTPTKKEINIPSVAAINALRTPPMEFLKSEFLTVYGQTEHEFHIRPQPQPQPQALSQAASKISSTLDLVRDLRPPLITLN